MSLPRWSVAVLALALIPYAQADLTLRHTFAFHFASFLPPAGGALVEYQMDLADLSTAEIPDSVFTVPAGYQPPLEDLVQVLVQAPSPFPTAAPQRLR